MIRLLTIRVVDKKAAANNRVAANKVVNKKVVANRAAVNRVVDKRAVANRAAANRAAVANPIIWSRTKAAEGYSAAFVLRGRIVHRIKK
jgi:hypothetical protein